MNTTGQPRSSRMSKLFVILLSVAAGACGEIAPEELTAQDDPSSIGAPSSTDPTLVAPVVDQRMPAAPGLSDPEIAVERPAVEGGEATAAAVVGAPGLPGGNGLAIQPRKGEGSEPAPRDLIPGNQPAVGAAQLPPVSPPTAAPSPAACEQVCPAGTVLDAASCSCQCPAPPPGADCRQDPAQGNDSLCACAPGQG